MNVCVCVCSEFFGRATRLSECGRCSSPCSSTMARIICAGAWITRSGASTPTYEDGDVMLYKTKQNKTKQNKTKQNKTAVCGFIFCTRLYCQVNFVLEGDDVEMTWRGFKASTVTANLTLNCQSHITTVLNDSLTAQRLGRRRIDGWWAIWRST